jgi:RNA polymerase sigma-70 factor (ECF subfamily)
LFLGRKARKSDFEAAALPHLKEIYRTAAHLVQDRNEAQAWKAFDRFQTGTNCRAWLFKILINEVRHYRRRFVTNKVVADDGQVIEQSVAYEPPIPEEIRDEDLLDALDGLIPELRELILLVDVNSFSYKEVAENLNLPIGTVMSRLSRARKQLRLKLADYAQARRLTHKEEVHGQ